VGATFYGARQVALVGTLIGLVVTTVVMFAVPGKVGFWLVASSAAGAGVLIGWLLRFPDRCSLHVPGKAMAGLMTGAACGALLAFVEPLHPDSFHITAAVAFLVSVNGVLYVATLPWWVAGEDQRRTPLQPGGVPRNRSAGGDRRRQPVGRGRIPDWSHRPGLPADSG
jgi:hypothetical protein